MTVVNILIPFSRQRKGLSIADASSSFKARSTPKMLFLMITRTDCGMTMTIVGPSRKLKLWG